MGWDGTYYGYYKKDCSMSHSKVSNFCVFWGLNIALKSPQCLSTELIISQCKVNVKIYLIHIMWNSQKKNSNCSVCGTGCRCCALHNFPFFFFPLSSTASRLRLILGGGGGVMWGLRRLFYGRLAPLVARRWGQGRATSFCNKLNSLKADPSLFPPKIAR